MMLTENITYDAVVIENVGIDTNVYLYGNEIDFSVEANFKDNTDYFGQRAGYASRGHAPKNGYPHHRYKRRGRFFGNLVGLRRASTDNLISGEMLENICPEINRQLVS